MPDKLTEILISIKQTDLSVVKLNISLVKLNKDIIDLRLDVMNLHKTIMISNQQIGRFNKWLVILTFVLVGLGILSLVLYLLK